MIVDDIVLYDAALPGEERPFPERPIFTGWFDTGQQGKEWPGDFAIVAHKPPRTWKAARSVLEPKSGRPWLRLGPGLPLPPPSFVSLDVPSAAVGRPARA